MKASSTIWPLAALIGGALVLSRQKQTSGVGLLLSWDGLALTADLEPYRYPAFTPGLKKLVTDGNIMVCYDPQSGTYAIYYVTASDVARLICVIRGNTVYWSRSFQADSVFALTWRKRVEEALNSGRTSFTYEYPEWSHRYYELYR